MKTFTGLTLSVWLSVKSLGSITTDPENLGDEFPHTQDSINGKRVTYCLNTLFTEFLI